LKKYILEAMRFLYMYGPCYKSDFYQLLGESGRITYGRLQQRVLKERGNEAFLERQIEVEGVKRQAGQTTTIVALSQQGETYYKDHEEPRFLKFPRAKESLFTTVQLKRVLYPHLTNQKVFIMYCLAGVPCFPYEKPSLGYLSFNLSTDKFGIRKAPYSNSNLDRYYEGLNSSNRKEKLEEFLKAGAFYTKAEVTAYLKSTDKGSADSIKGVDWQGIFLSNTNLFVNFVLSYGENKRVYVRNESMTNLLTKLSRRITVFTNVARRIPVLADASSSSRSGVYENAIDAITIGIGPSHTYSEAMGNKRGRIKGKDLTQMTEKAREFDILDCTSKRFKRIYSIDDRDQGIRMLSYITSHSLEEWKEEGDRLFAEDGRFELDQKQRLYRATYLPLSVRALYLPVYEIKLLKRIADEARARNLPVLIAARKEMMETLSHCVHIESVQSGKDGSSQPGLWFIEPTEEGDNIVLGDLVDEKSGVFHIYNRNGYIAGRQMIDSCMASMGYKIASEKEYLELAKISMDQKDLAGDDYEIRCRFFNAVARSGAAEFIAPFKDRLSTEGGSPVKLIEAKPKEKKRVQHSTKTLGIYTTGEFKKQLDKLSNDMNTSTSALSRRILQTVVRKAGDTAEEKGISMKDALSGLLSSITVSKAEKS